MEPRVVIVTGAGRGIGRAIAERLAVHGDAVAVNDIDAAGAGAVAEAIEATGGRALATPGDVSDEASVREMVEGASDALGEPDVVVNNAGFVHRSPLAEMRVEDFDRMIAVHLRGTFLCTRAVLPLDARARPGRHRQHRLPARADRRRRAGALQCGQGRRDRPHQGAGPRGDSERGTGQRRRARSDRHRPGRSLSEEWRRAKAAGLPVGRFGEAGEVAETVAFLASDAAALYVGQTLGPNSGDVML